MPRRDGPYIVLSQRSPTTFVVASCDKRDEPLGVYHTSALTPFLNGTETQSPVVPLKKRGRPRKQPLIPRGTAGENAIMSASTPPRRNGLRRLTFSPFRSEITSDIPFTLMMSGSSYPKWDKGNKSKAACTLTHDKNESSFSVDQQRVSP
ncbi:retrovirus-related Pol polyprotein from transposon 412 [Trichonephila clavipes]|nr:retrovirus-related Pol polyprotein from transposon 412 [Trichonephila clavipes]